MQMSSTPTTVNIPSEYWSVKRYAIAGALVLALVAGAFGAGYLLTGTEPASPAAVEDAELAPVPSPPSRGGAPLRGGIQP